MAAAERVSCLNYACFLVEFALPFVRISPRVPEELVGSYLVPGWKQVAVSTRWKQTQITGHFKACIELVGFCCLSKYMKVLFKLLNQYFLLCSPGDYLFYFFINIFSLLCRFHPGSFFSFLIGKKQQFNFLWTCCRLALVVIMCTLAYASWERMGEKFLGLNRKINQMDLKSVYC